MYITYPQMCMMYISTDVYYVYIHGCILHIHRCVWCIFPLMYIMYPRMYIMYISTDVYYISTDVYGVCFPLMYIMYPLMYIMYISTDVYYISTDVYDVCFHWCILCMNPLMHSMHTLVPPIALYIHFYCIIYTFLLHYIYISITLYIHFYCIIYTFLLHYRYISIALHIHFYCIIYKCTTYCICIWSVIPSISNRNRSSSFLGLFCHVPLKRDQGDWDWRLRLSDTPNAIVCTSIWMRSHMNEIPYECDPIWMKKWHSKCNRLYVDMNEIPYECDPIWMWSHMNVIPYEPRNDTPNAIGCT